MPLEWSEPRPPIKDVCHYDHVVASTPLGEIRLEWKSWKDYDAPSGHMPWDEYVWGVTLDEAKQSAQVAWDAMLPKLVPFCSKQL